MGVGRKPHLRIEKDIAQMTYSTLSRVCHHVSVCFAQSCRVASSQPALMADYTVALCADLLDHIIAMSGFVCWMQLMFR